MGSSELELLFKMIEDLITKVRNNPWVTMHEIKKIESIISKYKGENVREEVNMLTEMREELYQLYDEHNNAVKSSEKYTRTWETERRLRDMYFKFLNIPILFLIGIRDESFALSENVNNSNSSLGGSGT